MTKDELQQRVAARRWFHILDLGQGVITPGVTDPVGKEGPRYQVAQSLAGKTVLDVGAWDGAWSFEAKRRGAERVLATDSYSWGGGGWGEKRSFELAREVLGLDVEDDNIDIFELSPQRIGTFDIVFFFGVIYHMRNPLGALEHLRSVTASGGLAIVESFSAMNQRKEPLLTFYPGSECGNDPTNWFAPNPPGLRAMLLTSGFTDVSLVWPPDQYSRMTFYAR